MSKFVGSYNLHFLRAVSGDCLTPKPIFGFTLDPVNPLTFVNDAGLWVRPAGYFETDCGSVPPCLQGIAGPLDSYRGFFMHDSAFDNHGWWESIDQGKTWQFVLKSEQEVNDALYDWCRADGVDWVESHEIEWAVNIGGTALWNGHPGPFPCDPSPASFVNPDQDNTAKALQGAVS